MYGLNAYVCWGPPLHSEIIVKEQGNMPSNVDSGHCWEGRGHTLFEIIVRGEPPTYYLDQ